eukprot:c29275_g1_i2 orf=485-4546(+)
MRNRVGRSRELGRTGFTKGLSIVLEDGTRKGSLATGVRPTIQESGKSDMEQTLRHIFDVPMASETTFSLDNRVDIGSIQSYLQTRLSDLSNLEDNVNYPLRDGVSIVDSDFGDGVVIMDGTSLSGEMRLTKGSLVVESQAIFSSIRANACVCKGKWMYEVILETAGIQQLGWATRSCSFTREEGVGDSKDSYAYDGKRVRKWSESCQPYGQPWVPGDVIGCCIDLDAGQISFYRNGYFLGVAFDGVGSVMPKLPYYPAISLSQGERCELNFGARPFKYPIKGFFAIQASPVIKDGDYIVSATTRAHYLLGCLQRLVQLDSHELVAAMTPVERLRRLKPLSYDSYIVGEEICKPLVSLLSDNSKGVVRHTTTYLTWGALVPFLMEIHGVESPHDGSSVDRALDLLLPALDSQTKRICIAQVMEALAFGCRTSPITLVHCPYTGSYPYLALACHLLHRDEVMVPWCRSEEFESCLEGLLTRKGPNKFDLGTLLPTVWWPGSREDLCSESNMRQTVSALSKTIDKVEELQWQLCRYLLDFVPHQSATDMNLGIRPSPEPVFRTFVKHLMNKNKGAARNIPPPGLSDNSVLVAVYTVLLRLLSEGLNPSSLDNGKEQDCSVGFLHRGGKQCFKARLFLDSDTCANDFSRLGGTFSHLRKTHVLDEEEYKDVEWEEGFMDDGGSGITHSGKQKPCCCSGLSSSSIIGSKTASRILRKSFNIHLNGVSVSNSNSSATDVSNRILFNEEVEDTPSSSGRGSLGFTSLSFQHLKKTGSKSFFLSDGVREDELLDTMVLLYHLGVAPNFKQASYYLQHQLQAIGQLDETDRQIHAEQGSGDFLRRLKEARALYREDLIDCVRQSTWYRVSLFSRWKQRGMYATCMWISQLLLLLSKKDVLFSFVPEYYVETLLDCFHALRRSDPPFVSPMALLQQGLSSLVTFLAGHFNDTRIANSDIRDVLLQSISVLVQYKEHLVAFECNSAAVDVMPVALLSSFDSRFWIPVTNILLRLCKGSGFGASKSSTHGESCSARFQCLLRECCITDEKLFSCFLNRLFNTLNWTISEFSVSLKEMQEQSDQRQLQGPDLQQRKCTIMFELSCNLERVLEFFTHELPQAFLCGSEMNLLRLCEVLMFILNHTTSSADALLFDSTVRQQGQSPEKMNRAMILAPLVGIILNLFAAQISPNLRTRHDLAETIANVDVSSAAIANFHYLLEYNWASAFKGDPSLPRLCQLRDFIQKLKAVTLPAMWEELEDDLRLIKVEVDHAAGKYCTSEEKDDICSICYVCEVNTMFFPCKHKSCWRCISRHLLNSQRCFFCNGTVQDLRTLSAIPSNGNSQFRGPGAPNGLVAESGVLVKIDSP